MASTDPVVHNGEVAERVEKLDGESVKDSGTTSAPTLPSNHAVLKRASTTPQLSSMVTVTTSTTTSPLSSREPSPTRISMGAGKSNAGRATRSRNNSQDLSPNRTPAASGSHMPSVPSAAAIQRQLSATGIPHLPPPSKQDQADVTKPQKQPRAPNSTSLSTPANTSRLKSPPPPSNSSTSKKSVLSQTKKADQSHSAPSTPTIVVDDPHKKGIDAKTEYDFPEEERPLKSGMRTPTRATSSTGSTLETVKESGSPGTLTQELSKPALPSRQIERPERIDESPEESLAPEPSSRVGSENESGENRSGDARTKDDSQERRASSTTSTATKVPIIQQRKSFTQLPFTKSKPTNEPVKNMTVETETVSSIPQVSLGGGAGDRSVLSRAETTQTGGSLRLKPSTETIRPKKEKEKKKVVRKTQPGTASSKADIFEQKVATAVDQNSSDSEETFVYESNPPEPQSARTHRFHSRTPSAASVVSQFDYGTNRRPEANRAIAPKKSMKFANNYNSVGHGQNDTITRAPGQSVRNASSNTSHHHHFGRHGRSGHTSILDNDSPFPSGGKSSRSTTNHHNLSPKHSSPRLINISKTHRKAEEMSYDLEGEGADDERAPLIGSLRSGRNRRRPLPGSVRQQYQDEKGYRCCGRMTAFISIGSLLVLLITAIVAICVLASKPLKDVYIHDIRDVLISEEELMLDLNVHAMNPNIIAIQVNDMSVDVFAKSKHVGNSELWERPHHHRRQSASSLETSSFSPDSDKSSSPPGPNSNPAPSSPDSTSTDISKTSYDHFPYPWDPDPSSDTHTMLLGRVTAFDSPLIFDPSPFQHRPSRSIGEIRISEPGSNNTSNPQKLKDSARKWRHVSAYDFELIVKGVLKYSSPIGSKVHSARVAAKTLVRAGGEVEMDGEWERGRRAKRKDRPPTEKEERSSLPSNSNKVGVRLKAHDPPPP